MNERNDSPNSLALVRLTALMDRTGGIPDVKIGLIDGPVFTQHAQFTTERLSDISKNSSATCTTTNSLACIHGTFVAGILSAKRNSLAPAICPNCTLLVRPVFAEATSGIGNIPNSTPLELAAAITECIDAGARIINLSLGLAYPSAQGEQALEEALHQAVIRGVIVVAAAGNQGTLGSTAITRHQWVIPVVACNSYGRPMNESNLGSSIGRRGLSAPGSGITSLGTEGQPAILSGTSVAVPFVTGAIALLWSEFPAATGAQIKIAVTQATTLRRASVVPPLLDAAAAYQILVSTTERRRLA